MSYLLFTGAVSMLFGLLLLFSPEILSSLGKTFNRTVMVLDDVIAPAKTAIGIVLVAAGAWMLWEVFPYGSLWYLNLIACIILFFGLLFLVFPTGLKSISEIADRILLSTDDIVMGARKTIGILLLILSIYVFYSAFYAVTPSGAK